MCPAAAGTDRQARAGSLALSRPAVTWKPRGHCLVFSPSQGLSAAVVGNTGVGSLAWS